jgi:hypothetical protein
MTASSTCSNTWFRTRVEFRVCTRESRSCCCSIHGNSPTWSVLPSLGRRENFRVTLPSWMCAPWVSGSCWTRAALTYTPCRLPWSSMEKLLPPL